MNASSWRWTGYAVIAFGVGMLADDIWTMILLAVPLTLLWSWIVGLVMRDRPPTA